MSGLAATVKTVEEIEDAESAITALGIKPSYVRTDKLMNFMDNYQKVQEVMQTNIDNALFVPYYLRHSANTINPAAITQYFAKLQRTLEVALIKVIEYDEQLALMVEQNKE